LISAPPGIIKILIDRDEFMNTLRVLTTTQNGFMGCAICGKPLRLAESKSDGSGWPVHEKCYLLSLEAKQAPSPPQKTTQLSSST